MSPNPYVTNPTRTVLKEGVVNVLPVPSLLGSLTYQTWKGSDRKVGGPNQKGTSGWGLGEKITDSYTNDHSPRV